jgi:protein ImuB
MDVRGAPRVVATCARAARAGIVPGMALAQAKAFAADLVAAPWDDERLARAALTVTTALLAASPRVSWHGGTGEPDRARNDGVWWIDAAGLGEEKRLAQRLLRIAKPTAMGPVRVGIADSAIAAHAATFTRPPIPRSPDPPLTRIVPSGRDVAFLAPYPIALLGLDEELAETLGALGITTVGRLASLDPDEVESRFGPPGLAAHRLARGDDPRGPSTPRDDSIPSAECDLGGRVATAEPLLFVLKGALAALGGALRAKGLAAREVTIALALDDGSSTERAVRPARPTSHEDALFDHCRAALENWALPEPVVAVRLLATLTAPAAGEQGNLLAPRWADPAALEAAFDRIRGREGELAVATPESRDGHLPEDAGAWRDGRTGRRVDGQKKVVPPAARQPVCPSARLPSALRRLETPAPVRVRLGRAGLEAFRRGEIWHDVTAWSGPERLAGRWWVGGAPARDYFTARTAQGELWLLFRAGRDWFVEGWWD